MLEKKTFNQIKAEGYNQIPLIKRLPLGDRTPQALLDCFRGPDRVLLESTLARGSSGRYSIVVGEPRAKLTGKNGAFHYQESDRRLSTQGTGNPIEELRRIISSWNAYHPPEAPPFCGGALGYLAYECNHYLEKLPRNPNDDPALPDIYFLFVDRCMVVDHPTQTLLLIASGDDYETCLTHIAQLERLLEHYRPLPPIAPLPDKPGRTAPFSSDFEQTAYMDAVRKVQAYIKEGDTYQLNLSQRLTAQLKTTPFNLYRRLSMLNPVHFAGYLDLDGFQIACASPERLIRLDSGTLLSRPIAGTRRRGTPEEDQQFIEELKTDEKENAEHAMLVDLVRNDLGRVSKNGSVTIRGLMDIVKYASVIHIESDITGELRSDKDCIDALCALFPGGTITGVPKVRTMEIITELEPRTRFVYTGTMGYINHTHDMDFNIVIRTIVLKDGLAYVNVGGGVVIDSDPYREYKETLNKARSLLEALMQE